MAFHFSSSRLNLCNYTLKLLKKRSLSSASRISVVQRKTHVHLGQDHLKYQWENCRMNLFFLFQQTISGERETGTQLVSYCQVNYIISDIVVLDYILSFTQSKQSLCEGMQQVQFIDSIIIFIIITTIESQQWSLTIFPSSYPWI